MLGGCMQETLAPVSQAGWSVRDRQLMSNLPYAQATIPEEYRRHIVQYARRETPGTIAAERPSGPLRRHGWRRRASLERHRDGRP
jgi:hypothetical protein